MTNYNPGVLTEIMLLYKLKILNKLPSFKASFIRAGILVSLIAYWGVILVVISLKSSPSTKITLLSSQLLNIFFFKAFAIVVLPLPG